MKKHPEWGAFCFMSLPHPFSLLKRTVIRSPALIKIFLKSQRLLCGIYSYFKTEYAVSYLYLLCGTFHENATYVKRPDIAYSLIEKIFRFVELNYKGTCTLEALAVYTSHNYAHLSKHFKRYTGINFIEYVNHYRVNEARFLLRSSDRTILSVTLECGFDSLRNFNRVFKKIVGQTPSEYRRGMI